MSEVLRFAAVPVSAEVVLLELEGRFRADTRRRLGVPRLVVEEDRLSREVPPAAAEEAYLRAIELARVSGGNFLEGVATVGLLAERARSGRYSQLEVNRGLPARYLVRHLEQQGREWVVRQQLRALTRFEHGNPTRPQPGRAGRETPGRPPRCGSG